MGRGLPDHPAHELGRDPLAITWTVGRDDIGESDSVVNTITMSAQKSTKFVVARSGEWHEIRFVHLGDTTTGGLTHMQFELTPMGESGDTQDS